MQVRCFGFDWDEVRKRPNAEAIVSEMILTDDIDAYARELPDDIWKTDSAIQHFDVAEALTELIDKVEPQNRRALASVSKLISPGESIDELGLSPLTEGCYFASLSPARVAELHRAFSSLDLTALGTLYAAFRSEPADDFVEYLAQWQQAIKFIQEEGLGMIGHCG